MKSYSGWTDSQRSVLNKNIAGPDLLNVLLESYRALDSIDMHNRELFLEMYAVNVQLCV